MLYRQIILEWGQDTESGVWGLGYSPDNGKNFYVLNTIFGRKYRQEDADRLWEFLEPKISDLIEKKLSSQQQEGVGDNNEASHNGSSVSDKS